MTLWIPYTTKEVTRGLVNVYRLRSRKSNRRLSRSDLSSFVLSLF